MTDTAGRRDSADTLFKKAEEMDYWLVKLEHSHHSWTTSFKYWTTGRLQPFRK